MSILVVLRLIGLFIFGFLIGRLFTVDNDPAGASMAIIGTLAMISYTIIAEFKLGKKNEPRYRK